MNRIDETFQRLKAEGKKALIPFITGGDPDMETTRKLIFALRDGGADLIEIGVPFSDPMAEGPVIQQASLRALNGGVTLVKLFDLIKQVRQEDEKIPLLFMMYLNTIFRFGTERFFTLCKECGIDGVIVPDMPLEEQDEIRAKAERADVHSILLVSPTSGRERIQNIAQNAKGFLYCVSSTGVTGTRQRFSTDFEVFFTEIDAFAKAPTAIGFGISSPEQVREVKRYADGVIVGSAIVRIVGQKGKEAPQAVGEFIKLLRAALDGNDQ